MVTRFAPIVGKNSFTNCLTKRHNTTGKETHINRLRVVLAEKEITQKALAEMVEVSVTTISRICTNDSQPTLALLRDIVLALNVDIRE
jgi:putative transcriptional regulator